MLIQQVLFFRKCVREKNTKKSERQVGKMYREKVLLVWGKDDLLMT